MYVENEIENKKKREYTIVYAFYSQGHRCHINGCGSILVMDGNMKNHRDVCAAQEAGYAQFSGLPGSQNWLSQHTTAEV